MTRVPALVQGIARTAIYRLAVEKGHSVITSDLLDEAMDRYMPKGAKAATKLAEARRARARRGALDLDLPEVRRLGVRGQRRRLLGVRQHAPSRWSRPRWSSRSSRWRAAAERDDLRRPQAHLDARRQAGALDHAGRLQAPAREGARREVGASEAHLDRQPRVRPSDDRGGDRHPGRAARRRRCRGGPRRGSATARS